MSKLELPGFRSFTVYLESWPMTPLRSAACILASVLATVAILCVVYRERNAAAEQEMSDALEAILNLKSASYHVMLREASLLAPPILQGREWAEVLKLLEDRSFATVEGWENGDYVHSDHLLRRGAVTFANGHSLDLDLLLSAPIHKGLMGLSHRGRLDRPDVALVANISAPYPQVISEQRYPRGSVLDLVLHSERVKEAGEEWPLLKKVSVHYGYIDNRYVEHNPSGFHVCVEFTASATERIAGKRMYFYVPSGLDPLQSRDGNEKLIDGFNPQDTVCDIISGGGNEWWHGTPGTVEVNQRRFLRTKQ